MTGKLPDRKANILQPRETHCRPRARFRQESDLLPVGLCLVSIGVRTSQTRYSPRIASHCPQSTPNTSTPTHLTTHHDNAHPLPHPPPLHLPLPPSQPHLAPNLLRLRRTHGPLHLRRPLRPHQPQHHPNRHLHRLPHRRNLRPPRPANPLLPLPRREFLRHLPLARRRWACGEQAGT